MNSDAGGGGGGRQRGSSGGGSSPIRKLASPFMDGGRLPLPILQPAQPRIYPATERPDRWGEISPRPWGGNSFERQVLAEKRVEVDKDVARNMDSVFKELLGKTSGLKQPGADEHLNHPNPPDPLKSNFMGRKGATPGKQISSNRVLLRGRVAFKSAGNGE